MAPSLDIPDALLLRDADLGLSRGDTDDADRARALLRQQRDTWPLLRENYQGLDRVESRRFTVGRSELKVQWNPARLISTTAAVDERSLRSRPCFLCAGNLPPEQRGIVLGREFVLLANPYPIFPEHFTLAHVRHTPQRVREAFRHLLDLSASLGRSYALFYNGPSCGASAPDHLHFQAGTRGFMLLEDELPSLLNDASTALVRNPDLLVQSVDDGIRRFFVLESPDLPALEHTFQRYHAAAAELMPDENEPKMNILVFKARDSLRVLVFPRARHRPAVYFEKGEGGLLISPAAVDLGGLLITPREKDFRKITGDQAGEILREVSVSSELFARLRDRLAAELA